ncbi:unnamed protein product, partial [Hapterophycus canaliculatus]
MHTAAVRSSALGTRIAAAATPPCLAVVPEPHHAALLPERDISEKDPLPLTTAIKKKAVAPRRKLTRPTSAPVRGRTATEGTGASASRIGAVGKSGGAGWQSSRNAGRAEQREAERRGGNDDAPRRRAAPGAATRVRLGQGRARPASAQPISSRIPTPTSDVSAAASATTGTGIEVRRITSRRRPYRARGLPPPWDDNSSTATGCSSASGGGGGGGGCRSSGRRRVRAASPSTAQRAGAASIAPESLTFGEGLRGKGGGGGSGDRGLWDDKFYTRLWPRSLGNRRAPAAKATVTANAASEAAARATAVDTAIPIWLSPGRSRGTAVVTGRPYMSRAERAAAESKELATLRDEVEFWRREAVAARAGANEARQRLEAQEESIARVLHQTAEVAPTFRYGLDLDKEAAAAAASAASSRNRPSHEPPRIAVLEHRRELERSLMARRLRGQVSRLAERLAAAEKEVVRLKRSCQFTALAEMMSAGEEYAKEVERLRAMLIEAKEVPNDRDVHLEEANPASIPSRVVDIPSAAPTSAAMKTKTESKLKTKYYDAASSFVPRPSERAGPEKSCCSSSCDGIRSPPLSPLPGEDHAELQLQLQRCKQELNQQQQQQQQKQQQQQQRQLRSRASTAHAPRKGSNGRCRARGKKGHRVQQQQQQQQQQRQRRGEAFVSSRARAGLLGVIAPGGSRGYMAIDGPIATGRGTSSGRNHGQAADDGSKGFQHHGRVGVTAEMEIDVMKGLVLAQQQRIERQRSRMQELERDIRRDHRRAASIGREWPAGGVGSQEPKPLAWKGG